MNRIRINGVDIVGGRHVSIINGVVTVDGKVQDGKVEGRVELHVLEGVIEQLDARGATVTCGEVRGDVQADVVTCANVGGNVRSDIVTCGAVCGDVRADMVTCENIAGSVTADMVTRR